jgi:hypothetical protein
MYNNDLTCSKFIVLFISTLKNKITFSHYALNWKSTREKGHKSDKVSPLNVKA